MNFPVSVRPRNSRSWHFVFWVPLLSLLMACGSAAPDKVTESPWKVAIDAERPHLSEYEWEILKDYEVSDAELLDAKQKAEACMHAKGLKYEALWPYGVRGSIPDSMSMEEHERHQNECEIGTMIRVQTYHLYLRQNPNNEDLDQLILTCLKEKGLVERTFTVNDLRDSDNPNYPSKTIQDAPDWVGCEINPVDNPELREYVDSLVH